MYNLEVNDSLPKIEDEKILCIIVPNVSCYSFI